MTISSHLARATAFGAAVVFVATTGSSALAKPKVDPNTVSKVLTPRIIDAIAKEMERSMDKMRIPGQPAPYLIRYKITEVEVNDVSASFGATLSKKENHFANIEAYVHVGDYKFDNSNFIIPRGAGIDGVHAAQLPLEPSRRLARRATWLATDRAFQEALYQYKSKRDFRTGGGGAGNSGVESYSKAKPLVMGKPVLVPKLESAASMEKRAKRVSATFRAMPHVRNSRVAFTSFIERRWYLTSEGTAAHDTRRVSGVVIVVHGQADDGQELTLYYSRYADTMARLPSDDDLIKEAKALAKNLVALRTAPVLERYIGPILFEGSAAIDIWRYTLTSHLGGSPVPEGLEKGQAKQYGGAFAGRISKGRVLAKFLSLHDDPTIRKWGKRPIIGGYAFDDEGVRSQRVDMVKNGGLQTLLMGRIPSPGLKISNGHARRYSPAGGFHGTSTNLFVTSKNGLSRKKLIKRLLTRAKDEGLDYGLVVKLFDDAALTATPEQSSYEMRTLANETDVEAPPPVLLAYRIYPDGREELVRGVRLAPVNVKAWKDILATGKTRTLKNYLASQNNNLLFKLRGIGPGFVPSAGVESSIVTPDLLFEELDAKGSHLGQRPFPAIPRPTP